MWKSKESHSFWFFTNVNTWGSFGWSVFMEVVYYFDGHGCPLCLYGEGNEMVVRWSSQSQRVGFDGEIFEKEINCGDSSIIWPFGLFIFNVFFSFRCFAPQHFLWARRSSPVRYKSGSLYSWWVISFNYTCLA